MDANTLQQLNPKAARKAKKNSGYRQPWMLHLMVLPAVLLVFVFSYLAHVGASSWRFKIIRPRLVYTGSPWVGLKHFRYMLENEYFLQITWNTLIFRLLQNRYELDHSVYFRLAA